MLLSRRTLSKVPEITLYFWIIKVLTTAMGEATSDYWVHQIEPVVAVALGFVGFCIALAWQLIAVRYIAPVYWLAVVMVAVFGTMAADVMHIGLGIPYAVSTVGFAVALAIIFVTWYRVEGTLSIHRLNAVLAFWFAYIVTRPVGAPFADWMGVPRSLSGLNWGRGTVAAGLTLLIVAFVAYVSVTRFDVPSEGDRRSVRITA